MSPANHEITRYPESEVALSFTLETGSAAAHSRPTISNPASKLFISFVGGLCAGRDGVVLEKTEAVFGRGDDCDVKLDGDTVSRYHCNIKRIGNAFLVEDTSRNGTYLNGERIAAAQLRDQDQLRVGQNILLIHLSSSAGTGALASKNTTPNLLPYLLELKPHIVIKGLEIGVTQPFGEDRITIGRRSDNHLVLDYDNISRQHLCIERKDEQYIATDMGSSNGTYLNDQRIQSAPLSDGDCLRIGNYTLTVKLRGQDCILSFKQITKT
ncbi:MAG: FHA domain-containing protein [Acidobacteria bacterium]|nr:FHA domain-containing protein [Acidobacteriota bacterium]MBI3427209.1 FHA domain-containing protein [Acidobacteriota bacterium]